MIHKNTINKILAIQWDAQFGAMKISRGNSSENKEMNNGWPSRNREGKIPSGDVRTGPSGNPSPFWNYQKQK